VPDFSFYPESHSGEAQPLLAHDFYKSAAEQGRQDEESRSAQALPEIFLQMILRHETCQRCGRDLERVFIWNNQRLCRKCMLAGQDSWEIVSGESRGADRAILIKAATPKPASRSIISRLLALIGVKKAPLEPLFVLPGIPELQAKRRMVKDVNDERQMPRSEGIMKKKKKRKNQKS
jgi:hypothetical protein